MRTKHRIGGYRVIAPIGAGGSATVYRALNEADGTEVAIKVLAENHSLIAEMRRRFVEEVELLATVDSPVIAKIYEVGETENGQPYMVLDLADRGDLRRRVEEIRTNRQVMNRADLTMLAHHLYEGLSTLHAAGIVHRDVSPGNILIRTRRHSTSDVGITLLEPGERFMLADLGHAKDLEMASGLTAGGGTRGFAAPEQRDEVTVVDHRADIFSATAIMEWASHDGDYSEDLEPFFDTGLASEPEERFDTMAEWHEAFNAALGARALAAQGGGRSRWFRLVGAALLAAFLIAVIVVGYQASAGDGDDERTTSTRSAAEADQETGAGVELQVDDQTGSVDVDRDSLDVAGDENATPTTVDSEADPTTTDDGASSETTEPTDEEEPTTTSTATATTLDPFRDSPRAAIGQPEENEIVPGDLVMAGTVNQLVRGGTVRVVVRHAESGLHWNPAINAFQEEWLQFDVPVDETAGALTWQSSVPADKLEAGSYMVRVWARTASGQGDPVGDRHNVVVPS